MVIKEKGLLGVLGNTPVEKLCGIGPALKVRLNNLGVFSCLELLKTPKKLLTQHFGKVGLWLYAAVRLDAPNSPVEAFNSPQEAPKSIGHCIVHLTPVSKS